PGERYLLSLHDALPIWRWVATSVSVSEENRTPSASSSPRSCPKFSMMPLWMSATRPSAETWGCALRSEGTPWVAQRVCPMPQERSEEHTSELQSRENLV